MRWRWRQSRLAKNPGMDRRWGRAYLSREPGVIDGVSPTLRAADLLFFFSKYLLAKAVNFWLYSFSMALLSR